MRKCAAPRSDADQAAAKSPRHCTHRHARIAHPPLRPLLQARRTDAAAAGLCRGPAGVDRVAAPGPQPRGPRHLAGHHHPQGHGRGRGQAGLRGGRQHPRRRADGQHRLPVLAAPAGHGLRPGCAGHPAAGHARGLHGAAPEPGRRRAGAGRAAAAHPLLHPALPLGRAAGGRPDGGGRGRRRPHADDARARPARHLQEVPGRAAADGAARTRRVRRAVLPGDARGHAEELRRRQDPCQPRPRRPGPEPQLPGLLAPGIRAAWRRPLPHQRARGAGDGGLHHPAPEHRRGGELSHAQWRHPAAHGHAKR